MAVQVMRMRKIHVFEETMKMKMMKMKMKMNRKLQHVVSGSRLQKP